MQLAPLSKIKIFNRLKRGKIIKVVKKNQRFPHVLLKRNIEKTDLKI